MFAGQNFFAKQKGMHLCTECGTQKSLIAIPTKPPLLEQQSHKLKA